MTIVGNTLWSGTVRIFHWRGVFYFLCNLGKLAKRGGGGYPQALLKVINLRRMLELSKLLVLVRNPLLYSYDNNLMWKRKRKDSKRESKKWVSHRDPVECSGLLTRLRLTHYGYRLTVLRNEVSDTDCSSLNWATGNFHRCEQSNVYLIFQTACGRPPEGRRTAAPWVKK